MKLEFPDHPSQDALDDVGLDNRVSQDLSGLTVDRVTFGEAVKQMHVTKEPHTTREIVLLEGGGLVELTIDGLPHVFHLKAFDCDIDCRRNEVIIVSSRKTSHREALLEELARDLPSNRANDDDDRDEE